MKELKRYKYPRTYHLPYSPGVASDDLKLQNDKRFKDDFIVATVKMDGENATIYSDGYYHARSLDSKHKHYHSWLLNYIPQIVDAIPDGWRICGEYMFAEHSIFYKNLDSYFYVISVWNEHNDCLSWNDTIEFCKKNNLTLVKEVYRGIYDRDIIKNLAEEQISKDQEGLVIRSLKGFSYDTFGSNTAKYVRSSHIKTDRHWSFGIIQKNQLRKE